jgi:glutathione synthase/RimK-type ligase-like ATP-grasp enzyme
MVLRVPSPEQERIALDVARVTGLDILGVDIIQSVTGQNYVIDVNTFPGLYPDLNRQFGSDVAQLCVEVIEQKLEPERVAIAP